MGVDSEEVREAPSAIDLKSWLPFAVFTDTEKLAGAALAAKTLVAEVRAARGAPRTALAREASASKGFFVSVRSPAHAPPSASRSPGAAEGGH
jgi:hypothetical protein